MKIIVTHTSPDWDAITSVWLLKKFLAGWQDAEVGFVPAGQKYKNQEAGAQVMKHGDDPIEKVGEDEIVHVDTGLTPLDHHQTQDTSVSAASLSWDYVRGQIEKSGDTFNQQHQEAIARVVKFVVDTDHFKEVYWADPVADYHEFTLLGLLEGYKQLYPDQDKKYVSFGFECLSAMVAVFENRIWAENEIKEKGIPFETRFGKAIGFETINDTVLKLSQKMGYVIVVRKDPRKGYVRIKTLPAKPPSQSLPAGRQGVDLTLAYEQLKKIDPDATWFLHVSKKMLLNGTPKNPKMRPTKLALSDIIKVLSRI